ncbi:MAG: hypothetical protein KGL39_23050 [Patescibacteria group bacterium]|nr:hypothetical protein [Patescibacteria group bacterium]
MTNYTVRPTSVIRNAGNPSGSVLTNINDNNDATFAQRTTTGTIEWNFRLATASVAADEFICRIGTTARLLAGTVSYPCPTMGFLTAKDSESRPALTNYVFGPSIPANNTREMQQRSVSWAKADLAALYLIWSSTILTTTNVPRIAELLSTIYTIKQSSAALTATTMASSSYADIPVTVNNTIGFEADDSQTALTRKVTVDVQVESGGTGVGTGTVMATRSFDFTITGTTAGAFAITDTLHLNTPLPNGNYKVYARTRRYNDAGEPPNSEGVSAWAASVALTISVAPPVTPTLTTATNQTNDTVTISVTPTSSAGYTSPTIDLQRSDDGGTTWNTVRNATALAATFGAATNITDYEAPRGIAAKYRARVNATFTGGYANTSAWSSAATATAVTADDWQLKCPEIPALNIIAPRIVDSSEEIDEDLGVFRPVGRSKAVVVSGDLTGWDGSFKITTTTAAEWAAVKALIECQKVWLLQSPFGTDRYVRRVGKVSPSISGTPSQPIRRVQIAYVETSAP